MKLGTNLLTLFSNIYKPIKKEWLPAVSEKEKLALAFIFTGTIGNLIDRILHGFVVDFIDFHFWPVFNIADASNVVGVLLLIYFYVKDLNLNKTPIKYPAIPASIPTITISIPALNHLLSV